MIRSRDYASFRKGKSIFFTMTKRKELCMLATDPHGHKQTLEHSLKIPWRPTKCIVQVKLVHPFLALHSLPALTQREHSLDGTEDRENSQPALRSLEYVVARAFFGISRKTKLFFALSASLR
jgi:hypothetical protein